MRLKKRIGFFSFLLIAFLLPFIVTSPYHINIFIMVAINTILSMTFVLVFRTGLLTLGIAGFYVIGAYCSAVLTKMLGISFWLALPIGAIVTGIITLMLGLIIIRSWAKGSELVFLFFTIIFNLVIVKLIGYTEVLGGLSGMIGIPRPEPIFIPFYGPIEFSGKVPYYYLICFLLILTMIVFYAFYTSQMGRAWRAIKLSPQLAASLGINIFRYRLLAFVISGAFAGLVGSFYASYSTALVPENFGILESIFFQIYAILGGLNFYISGPIIGALILTWIPELLRISKELEPIISGFILVTLVVFLPGGILSLPERISRLQTLFVKITRNISQRSL